MWGFGPPRRGGNRGIAVRIASKITVLGLGLALGACAMPDTDSFKAPTAAALFRPLSVTSFRENALPPVSPEDLVRLTETGPAAGGFWRLFFALPLLAVMTVRTSGPIGRPSGLAA